MLLHPPLAHFAIVLPVVASVFGLLYLMNRSETMSKIAARTAVAAAIAMIAVWYTGNQSGPLIYNFLDTSGKEELLEHKQLGLYLAVAMTVVALMQAAGCKMKNFAIQALGIILTVGVMATTFLQGKHGGEIVYEHGKPFQMTQLQNYIENDEDLDMADDEEKVGIIKEAILSIGEATCEKIGCKADEKEDEEE